MFTPFRVALWRSGLGVHFGLSRALVQSPARSQKPYSFVFSYCTNENKYFNYFNIQENFKERV